MTHEDQIQDQDQPKMGEGNGDNGVEEIEPRVESLRAPSLSRTALFSRRGSRSRTVRLALGATTLVVLIAVVAVEFALTRDGSPGGSNPFSGVVSNILHVTPNPTATPTRVIYPTPTLGQEAKPALGSTPTGCLPPAPAPRTVSTNFSGAIGGSPVWVAGFEGSHATEHINPFSTAHTRYGWAIGIVFAIEPGLTDPVVVRGERLKDGTPLWLQVAEPGKAQTTPSVAVVLDPQQPGLADFQSTSMGLSDDWAAWNDTLYIPDAGCYALDARWPGGSWRVTFIAS